MKDLKAALGNHVKPDITHVRKPMLVYTARACEYGSEKYQRANYIGKCTDIVTDFKRVRSYLRAMVSHAFEILDSMEYAEANPNANLRYATYAEDTDPDTSGKVGPSYLPHWCGVAASLNMALQIAVESGLLPADPGPTWEGEHNETE